LTGLHCNGIKSRVTPVAEFFTWGIERYHLRYSWSVE